MAPSIPRTRVAAALRMKQIALDNQDRTIRRLRAQLATERQRLAATKKELEETRVALEASHKALVDEKDSLLQTIHGLQEANNAPPHSMVIGKKNRKKNRKRKRLRIFLWARER
ncbi:hypothetical protein F511_14159 [Dorcoceras hygrometricum]|uniref:Uncharacterized protein n=1 Tax=Dorcoceras hygrometricum TaxID=472368 RepID=A0A2Z7CYU7_9LAMI|nr:hypothetical protein F511_14159 [Dorcoceras hygrometricum]